MAEKKPIRFKTDARLDFNHFKPLRKSYIVASSYRSGSEFLCWGLWQTGLLGAPGEFLNPTNDLPIFMNRLKASSPADYFAKLIARRTSKNGVFGMKAHFRHFQPYLKEYPQLLEVLAPVTYIRITRDDKIAQAVSMAKALQTNWWTSRIQGSRMPPLRYDREMIANCIQDLEQQELDWQQWFEAHDITPFEITYSDLTSDPAAVVRSVVELLGVQNDERDKVDVPPAEKQADETNQEWIERFRRDLEPGGKPLSPGGAAASAKASAKAGVKADEAPSAPTHFCDRFARLIETMPEGPIHAPGFVEAIRLRRRYDAIIAQNRELFQNARALDIMSAHGFWSLAALDAGAAHVTGVESSPKLVKAVEKNFSEYGVKSESYRFIRSRVFAALEAFKPAQFDIVLCKGFFEQCHFPEFFRQMRRLRPKYVVLDTKITPGYGPMARFEIAMGPNRAVISIPTHDLIAFLCQRHFRWRLVDWQAMGITDWTGVQDYARGTHRTYVLNLQ